jgi:hypothetical protein
VQDHLLPVQQGAVQELQQLRRGQRVKQAQLVGQARRGVAHLATVDVGHTEAFWHNMAWLVREAIAAGVYTNVDFGVQPQSYCGVRITSSVVPPDATSAPSKDRDRDRDRPTPTPTVTPTVTPNPPYHFYGGEGAWPAHSMVAAAA